MEPRLGLGGGVLEPRLGLGGGVLELFGAGWRCLELWGWVEVSGAVSGWVDVGVWGVLGWEEPFLAGSYR